MIKYIFLGSPYHSSWLNVTKKLFLEKIAKPVIFIGHDRHYIEAKNFFGENVFEDFKIRHRSYEIIETDYNGENIDFFESKNYLRAKDICLKLMDRLDIYGMFNRIDREVYFHQLCILFLKKIELSKPDLLIAAESPHDHSRYIIYEISRYLKIPCFKFNNWTIAPLLIFQNLETGKLFKSNLNVNFGRFSSRIDLMIKSYVNSVQESSYEIGYMKDQRKNTGLSKVTNQKTSINYFKDLKYNIGMLIKKKYNPINPYMLNIFSRILIINRRKNNLIDKINSNEQEPNLKDQYVYFPLHFEPERTSNPDAGDYQDQFKALSIIRRVVPKEYKIYVKEHPSQVFFKEKGSRGRSSLFYSLIKNINSVVLINRDFSSQKLIKNSKCIFTLTGTVAIESAILGKPAITFGSSTWYSGCPNTIVYSKDFDFAHITKYKISPPFDIQEYLFQKMEENSIPGFINFSQKKYFKDFDNDDFIQMQDKFLFQFLSNFLSNRLYN